MQIRKPGGRNPVSLTEWSRNEFAQKMWPFFGVRGHDRAFPGRDMSRPQQRRRAAALHIMTAKIP